MKQLTEAQRKARNRKAREQRSEKKIQKARETLARLLKEEGGNK